MELTLKKGHIYIPTNNRVTLKLLSFSINVKDDIDISNYTKTVYINNNPIVFEDEFSINLQDIVSNYLDLKIVLTHRDTGELVEYTADKYPVTAAYVLGLPVNDWYPSVIQSLIERVAKVEDNIKLIEQAIIELDEKGDLI